MGLKLTPLEDRIFDLLRGCVLDEHLHVVLRVAGGWVRDKLLGIDSHDIDIAVDSMSGEDFAERFKSHLSKRHTDIVASSCGIVHANPERSKHLETATLRVLGLPLDFVNLRAESYAQDSRIPTAVHYGTPLQDAQRRDITINALFYNIMTQTVEDLTGLGLSDLADGIVRTPLAPEQTLLDDPLRILRVIRFATRFQYRIDPDLYNTMRQPHIRAAFASKVSRERVGIELDKILRHERAFEGLQLIVDTHMYSSIFDAECPYEEDQLKKLLHILHCIALKESGHINEEEKRWIFLGGALIPYMHHETSIIPQRIMRESLKLSNRDVVRSMIFHERLNETSQIVNGIITDPIIIGRNIRRIGTEWKVFWQLTSCYMLFNNFSNLDQDSKSIESESCSDISVYDVFDDNPTAMALIKESCLSLKQSFKLVSVLNLGNAHSMKPLLSGTDIQRITGERMGPSIGSKLNSLIDWQLQNPLATQEDAASFIQSLKTDIVDNAQ